MTEWLAEPKHYGCQASMLLPAALNMARPGQVGATCGRAGAAAPLSPEQVAAVVALVRDPSRVPFVGILEAWNASVALFHAAFDGGSAVAPEELENIHVSRPSSGGSAGCATLLPKPRGSHILPRPRPRRRPLHAPPPHMASATDRRREIHAWSPCAQGIRGAGGAGGPGRPSRVRRRARALPDRRGDARRGAAAAWPEESVG